MNNSKLQQILEANGVSVNRIEVSPRGIITIIINKVNGKERAHHDAFKKLGIQVKALPYDFVLMPKELRYRVV